MKKPTDDPGTSKPKATVFARSRKAILWATPGQIDAGFASLATFITGLVAVRELSTGALAAYALLTSAYRVMNQFPGELVFSPSQIIAIDEPVDRRLGCLAHSVPRGAMISLVSALAVPLGALFVAGDLTRNELIALSITASILAVVSPIQDHVRAVLHMANVSWMAAVMSVTNLIGTAVALYLLYSSTEWAVYGSLFAGNLLSLVVGGLWIVRQRSPVPSRPTMGELYSLGGWLLTTGFAKTLVRYGVNALLSVFAGVAALGYVQGAAVVAQPVNVFTQGIMSQVGPRLTEAGSRRERGMARRWTWRFLALLSVVTLPYILFVSFSWSFNPFVAITPRAYEVTGLVAATVFVVAAGAFTRSLRLQLLGARRQRMVALITLASGGVELATVVSGVVIGAYAAPLAAGGATALTMAWYSRILLQVYRGPSVAREAAR